MAIPLLTLDALPEFIFGAEGEASGAGDTQGASTESTGDTSGAGEETAGSGSEAGTEENSKDDEDKGLSRALAAERAARKAADKKATALQKAADERELAEKTEIEQERTKAEKATSALDKLKDGFLKTKLDAAIEKAAKDFTDPEDVLNGVDRKLIEFEQDEDDPSEVTIDLKTVERAVKALATKKPHWLKTGTDDGEATGGKFGNGQGQGKKKSTDDQLRDAYPALRS